MNLQQVKGDLRVIDLARKWTLDMRKCAFETRCDFFTMDQIVRAATSVHLNLVEGSHSIYPGIAAQSFSTARASIITGAPEVAGALAPAGTWLIGRLAKGSGDRGGVQGRGCRDPAPHSSTRTERPR